MELMGPWLDINYVEGHSELNLLRVTGRLLSPSRKEEDQGSSTNLDIVRGDAHITNR